jgi:hypothetical protein
MSAAPAKLRYSLRECEALLGISENTIRRRIAEGALETHLDGDRRFVSARALTKYVEAQERAAQASMRASA